MRFAVPRALALGLVLAGLLGACGKDSQSPAAPHPVVEVEDSTVASPTSGTGGSDEAGEAPQPRMQLEAEFHRTRFGLGTGLWVLGVVHNPHGDRVTDVHLQVRLLDEADEVVGRAEGRLGRTLAPGERAGVAVHVVQPVAHEQLQLEATAIVDEGSDPEPLTLRIEHEPAQRADFGGWYIVGKIENTGSAAIDGARIEIQGLDASGELLGIDWLALDPIAAGETVEFDVGDLRYEQAPIQFLVEPRGPAIE